MQCSRKNIYISIVIINRIKFKYKNQRPSLNLKIKLSRPEKKCVRNLWDPEGKIILKMKKKNNINYKIGVKFKYSDQADIEVYNSIYYLKMYYTCKTALNLTWLSG